MIARFGRVRGEWVVALVIQSGVEVSATEEDRRHLDLFIVSRPVSDPLSDPAVRRKLAVLRHADEVTGNVAMTCRYFSIRRQLYYLWLRRYAAEGLDGLRDRSRRPRRVRMPPTSKSSRRSFICAGPVTSARRKS
jgi:hypothetical protein